MELIASLACDPRAAVGFVTTRFSRKSDGLHEVGCEVNSIRARAPGTGE